MGSMGIFEAGLRASFYSGPGAPSLIGTAGYGPVRPVVWDLWLAERCSVSHGDPIEAVE